MSIKLKNAWDYKGDDWWEWSAFLDDGGTGELDSVDHVQYVLHETFPEPIRRIDTPKNRFKIDVEGWGTFRLQAFVHFKDGSKKKLRHEVRMEYDPKKGTSA